jgi:tetratricopeptide (TPR) repeat protein
MQSPYRSSEAVETDIQTVELQCHDGWITVGSFPSLAAVNKYSAAGGHAPELVLSSCGVHADPIIRRIHDSPILRGVPLALVSASLHVPPLVGNAREDEAARSTGEWEGISVYRIDYARSVGTGWQATVGLIAKLPVVYNGTGIPDERSKLNEWIDSLQGAADSRSEAVTTLQTDGTSSVGRKLLPIVIEAPASFFARRARQAEAAIRETLTNATPDELRLLASPLEEITQAREKRDRSIVKAPVYAPAPAPVVAPRPLSFVNRAEQRRTVARFVEGSTDKRILLLHGTPGIGKLALLAEVQRTDPFGRDWIRFRCVADASLAETLAQLMIRLGSPQTQPLPPTFAAYEAIGKQMATARCRILVLEDAHNLPIESGNTDHASLLEFFAFVCRTDMQPRPRILLSSEWRGHLNFSGSHLLEPVKLDGLEPPDMLYLLQELAATVSSKYPPPTVDELEIIASKTHGHPFVGQLAIAALENSPPAEVIEKLHQRDEVRRFVINKLLGRASLSQAESRFLQLASVFRIPVLGSAFSGVAGAQTNSIIAELVNRFLLTAEGDRYRLHPLIAEYFKSQIASSEDTKSLHQQAHNYFQNLQRVRSLTLDEKIESIYHAFASGNPVHLADLRLFTGPVRTAMFDALRDRDWPRVHAAAEQILLMFPADAVAKVANAVALDATGQAVEAEKFFDSVRLLDSEHLWVAIEFARSRIRRRDFLGAERLLEELEHRFSTNRSIQLAWAQLNEKQGLSDEAIQRCHAVLGDAGCRERDAFLAGLILRDANRLDLLIEHVEARYQGFPTNAGLQRLYGYACVVTGYAPADGLQTLSQQWSAAPGDGYVIADYASALSLTGRTVDAGQLFEQGLQDCKGVRNDRRALLEEYALFLVRSGQIARAHELYRELLRSWPYHLHNHRRFAQSLLDAAGAARASGGRGLEDSCVQEAEQVIRKLLEIAPADRWAAETLHRVQHRVY